MALPAGIRAAPVAKGTRVEHDVALFDEEYGRTLAGRQRPHDLRPFFAQDTFTAAYLGGADLRNGALLRVETAARGVNATPYRIFWPIAAA